MRFQKFDNCSLFLKLDLHITKESCANTELQRDFIIFLHSTSQVKTALKIMFLSNKTLLQFCLLIKKRYRIAFKIVTYEEAS